jgi:hypothetical protein
MSREEEDDNKNNEYVINLIKDAYRDARVSVDKDNGVIKVYTNANMLKAARSGLNDVLELAYTTAEHHPYWAILYNASEIINILLEHWDDDPSNEEIEEVEWRANELKAAIERLK